MKDEIKEILQEIIDDIYQSGEYTYQAKKLEKVLDYITNLQEIEKEHKNCTRKHWQQKCAEHCANEMIYKSRNEKAIEYIKSHKETREHYESYGTPMGNSNYTTTHIFGYYELLNILQGEENDN